MDPRAGDLSELKASTHPASRHDMPPNPPQPTLSGHTPRAPASTHQAPQTALWSGPVTLNRFGRGVLAASRATAVRRCPDSSRADTRKADNSTYYASGV